METGLEELTARLRQAVHERGWAPFHTPKNLAMALAGEAGELLAEFQWLTPEESRRVMDSPEKAEAVRSELADVFSYRGAGQRSGLEAGGEGPHGRAVRPERALPRPVLLLDVLV